MEYIHGADVRTLLAELTKKKVRLPLEHVLSIVHDHGASAASRARGEDADG